MNESRERNVAAYLIAFHQVGDLGLAAMEGRWPRFSEILERFAVEREESERCAPWAILALDEALGGVSWKRSLAWSSEIDRALYVQGCDIVCCVDAEQAQTFLKQLPKRMDPQFVAKVASSYGRSEEEAARAWAFLKRLLGSVAPSEYLLVLVT
jgi:hypothetical protein